MKNRMLVLVAMFALISSSHVSAANCDRLNPNYYHKSMVVLVNMTDSLLDKANGYDDRITVAALLDMVLQFQGICINARRIAENDSKANHKAAEISAFYRLSIAMGGDLASECKAGRNRPSASASYNIFVKTLRGFREIISSVA